MEGIKIPRYVKSDHQKLDLESMKEYMKGELYVMDRFHNYCMKNRIRYTLVAGSLMSCVKLGTYFPWDDDIDLVVRESDWYKIVSLWQKGTNERRVHDKRWIARDILIGSENFVMLMNRENSGWVKLLKEVNPFLRDIGGIDIGYSFEKDGKMYESMNCEKEAPGDRDLSRVRLLEFSTIFVMAVSENEANQYLDKVYSGWDIHEHPDYKKSLYSVILSRILK